MQPKPFMDMQTTHELMQQIIRNEHEIMRLVQENRGLKSELANRELHSSLSAPDLFELYEEDGC